MKRRKYDARYFITMNLLSELGYTQDEIHNIIHIKPTQVSNWLNGDVTRKGSIEIHNAIAEYILDECKTFCNIRTRQDANYSSLYEIARNNIINNIHSNTGLFQTLKYKYKAVTDGTRKEF